MKTLDRCDTARAVEGAFRFEEEEKSGDETSTHD